MKKRRLWMFATTLAVGFVALSGWSNRTLAEDQKPPSRTQSINETDDAPARIEPAPNTANAGVPDDIVVEEPEDARISPPIQMEAEPYDQTQMETTEGVTAAAQAPILDSASSKLSFQALLTDSRGDPLPDGEVKLEFNIYRGAALVEGPIQLTADILNGIVDTLVPVKRSSFNGDSRQLSVTLLDPPAGELLPRIQLGAVPYAFRVDRVSSPELDDVIELGTTTADGNLKVWDDSTNRVGIELEGASSAISTFGSDGLVQTRLSGTTSGQLLLHGRPTGNHVGVRLGVPSFRIIIPPNPPGPWIDFGGQMQLYDAGGVERLLASASSTGGLLQLRDGVGATTARVLGDAGAFETLGSFNVMDTLGGFDMALMYKYGGGGRIIMHDENDDTTFWGGSDTAGGFLRIYQADGGTGIFLDGDAGNSDDGGVITVYQADGGAGVIVDGDAANSDDGGVITVYQADGSVGVVVDGDFNNNNDGGSISIKNDSGNERILLEGDENNAGQIKLFNAAGSKTIELDGDWSDTGFGRVQASEIQILGGSDLSEQFDIAPGTGTVAPGMVVSIDPTTPGHLIVSAKAYDRTVAGIISGAGGVRSGMLMGQKDSEADGADAVALTGRVYCWCDAGNGAIQPGDLLTTSNTPGHAMKVADYTQSQGSIIGKAMTSLESGKGLVLVLVSLQ